MTLQESARGKLLITVIEAADLIASSDGKSDPFCVVKIGENQESATPTIQNNLNPQWNYVVSTQYRIYLSIDSLCIHLSIYSSINIIYVSIDNSRSQCILWGWPQVITFNINFIP